MRRITLALAASTLICAGSTVYFAREAQRLRAAQAGVTPAVPAPSGYSAPSQEAVVPSAPAVVTDLPAAAVPTTAPSSGNDAAAMRAFAVAEIPRLRRILENLRVRDKYRRDIVDSQTQFYAGLRDSVALGDDEFRRLVNLVADQQIAQMESQYRCALDEACDMQAVMQEDLRERRRQLSALLGEERRQQLENAIDNIHERNSVKYLRGMLPDTQPISDSQARELVDEMGAERREFVQELLETGAMPSSIYTVGTGATFPSTAQSVEDKVEAAQEYQRRMRQRAARILNAAQIEVFTQIQEDWLASVRAQWEFEARPGAKP